ncbi:hypothetical protein M8818_000506 [Zalaria obscura]|uniref:Uncharacterized protein n=1 Tax=Zalaria obscura TaxID=2024903 RepID=A0ACC3SQK6_9PEZI
MGLDKSNAGHAYSQVVRRATRRNATFRGIFGPNTSVIALSSALQSVAMWLECGATTSYRQCPMPGCFASLKLSKVIAHLTDEHEQPTANRQEYEAFLRGAGYTPDGSIICPVCPDMAPFPSHEAFEQHLVQKHIVRDSLALKAIIARLHTNGCSSRQDCDWPLKDTSWRGSGSSIQRSCPSCTRKIPSLGSVIDQIFWDTKTPEYPKELMEKREQILQLCPDFGAHPVFDDVRPADWRSKTKDCMSIFVRQA